MGYLNPSITDFKNFFNRDFPYGTTLTTVMDIDITNAMQAGTAGINPDLFPDQQNYSLGVYYLSAHYLVMNLRASSQGIAGEFSWLKNSKGVGSVNEGIAIPERILENPEFAYLAKTNYGARYLAMVLPQLSGQMFSVCGATRA